MAYSKTVQKVAGVTDAMASDYNNLRAELKAAAEGMLLSDGVGLTIAYNGDGTINTITYADAQETADLDLDAVATFAYNGDGTINTITTVFSKFGITYTVTFGYTAGKVTTISRAFS